MDELVVKDLIDRLIDLSFAEDIGDGDHTTLSCIPADAMGKSKLLIKEEGILAGIEVAKEVFRRFDPTMKVEVFIQDGTHVKPGDVAMVVEGKVQSLLQTERLMLNIMQRMSGIATMTNKYVKKLEGTKTRVLDTRKTTPGMRIMEKMAVKIGGGGNHRIGLFDMILLKDNHVDFAGGIHNAVSRWYYLRYYVALCAGRSGFHFFRCADSLREGAGYEFQGLLILVSFYDLLNEVKNLNVSSLFRSK